MRVEQSRRGEAPGGGLPFRGLLAEAYAAERRAPSEPTLADAPLPRGGHPAAERTARARPAATPPPLPKRGSPSERQKRARFIFKGAVEKRRAGLAADAHLDALLAAAIDPDNDLYKEMAARWALPAPAPRPRRSPIRRKERAAG